MTTIQLIGSISNNYNAEKQFKAVADKLEKAGYVVVNPFDLCAQVDKNMTINQYWWACMRLCIDSLQSGSIDIAIIVNNIFHSIGADIELRCANKFKIPYRSCFKTNYPIMSAYSELDYEEFERILTLLEGEEVQS